MLFTWLKTHLDRKIFVFSNCKMDFDTRHIQLQYLGFLNTALLWQDTSVFGLKQLILPSQKTTVFSGNIIKNLRLGKRVERFVSHQLYQYKLVTILAENIQIQQDKITLGELDCLLMLNENPAHVEIVYKFYLYDATVGNSELEHWIGPNRNDSLIQKLTKLKNKQLPLLHTSEAKTLLETLSIAAHEIRQYVHFKAQLFIPYFNRNIEFKLLNNACVSGFYLTYDELNEFSDSKFYIPIKVDWLMEIQTQTNWLTYELFLSKIEPSITGKSSVLCWIKRQNGELHKCFVIWWHK